MPSTPVLHYRLTQVFTLLLLAITLVTIFPPQTAWALWCSAHAVWVSLTLLNAGLVFFVFGRIRLAFVCLGYAAAISFWLFETGRGDAPLEPL
jgi:hypothetical protein